MSESEILVLGGVHGNEPFGVELVRSLQESPVQGVDALIANERAVEAGERFIDTELSAYSDPTGNSYEDQRLAELIKVGADYRLILDFHNAADATTYEAWMYAPAEALRKPVQWLLGVASIRYVITFNPDLPLYTALPQTVAIEQGLPTQGYQTWEGQQITRWRSVLQQMARIGLDNLQPAPSQDITHLELMGDISREQAKHAGLEAFADLQQYDSLPSEAAASLGLEPGAYRIVCWAYHNLSKLVPGTNGEREYWGQVGRELNKSA